MVQYSPIFVVEGHCQVWFWWTRVSTNHHRSIYASPAMYISQGDSLGVFQGSFSWFWSFLGLVQHELPSLQLTITIYCNQQCLKLILFNIYMLLYIISLTILVVLFTKPNSTQIFYISISLVLIYRVKFSTVLH